MLGSKKGQRGDRAGLFVSPQKTTKKLLAADRRQNCADSLVPIRVRSAQIRGKVVLVFNSGATRTQGITPAHSISTLAPGETRAATTTVGRAGGATGKNSRYTEFIPPNSSSTNSLTADHTKTARSRTRPSMSFPRNPRCSFSRANGKRSTRTQGITPAHSISTLAPGETRAATTTVERAGGATGKNSRYTEFIPPNRSSTNSLTADHAKTARIRTRPSVSFPRNPR